MCGDGGCYMKYWESQNQFFNGFECLKQASAMDMQYIKI